MVAFGDPYSCPALQASHALCIGHAFLGCSYPESGVRGLQMAFAGGGLSMPQFVAAHRGKHHGTVIGCALTANGGQRGSTNAQGTVSIYFHCCFAATHQASHTCGISWCEFLRLVHRGE